VVEAGSFAAAGRGLGRATSAVSYAIANLEQQLGVQLFDRDQARRPALTEAGAAVLPEARSVSAGAAQIALAVDVWSSAGPSVVRGWIETTGGVGF
jgi:DNA-binding transcriptional LysR family regulator